MLGAGTVSLKNAKQKMGEPNFISWIEAFIKLKQSRGIHTSIKNHEKQEQTFEDTLKAGESWGLSEENDDSNNLVSRSDTESVSGAKGTNEEMEISIKRKIRFNLVKSVITKQEQKKLKILES